MSKHTPGPWEVASGGSYKDGKYQLTEYFVRRPEDDVSIAADIIDPDTSKPSEANANLIAAAPDMLAACEYVALILTQRGMGGWEMQMLERVKAAIAQARGE